jgi:hypothetical protein
MAQNNDKTIILQRRSAVSGSRPTESTLRVGEIGLNTYDGKAFLHKSGSVDEIVQIVVAGSDTQGSINILSTGSFGELSVTNDANISGDAYITGDIIGNGDIDIAGAVSASIVSSSLFIGNGSQLTGVTASMRPDDFDFNSEPFAGTIGYIQGSGSLYKVATDDEAIDFRYNDITIATITQGSGPTAGFSGSLYGIGDVLAFSGSVANRLAALESGSDAGEF